MGRIWISACVCLLIMTAPTKVALPWGTQLLQLVKHVFQGCHLVSQPLPRGVLLPQLLCVLQERGQLLPLLCYVLLKLLQNEVREGGGGMGGVRGRKVFCLGEAPRAAATNVSQKTACKLNLANDMYNAFLGVDEMNVKRGDWQPNIYWLLVEQLHLGVHTE